MNNGELKADRGYSFQLPEFTRKPSPPYQINYVNHISWSSLVKVDPLVAQMISLTRISLLFSLNMHKKWNIPKHSESLNELPIHPDFCLLPFGHRRLGLQIIAHKISFDLHRVRSYNPFIA